MPEQLAQCHFPRPSFLVGVVEGEGVATRDYCSTIECGKKCMRLSHSVVLTYFDDMYLIVSNYLPPSIEFHGNWFLTELMAGLESVVSITRVWFTAIMCL